MKKTENIKELDFIKTFNEIPTVIINSYDKKIRKLSLTRYEDNYWIATYLIDDIGDLENKWTADGIIVKKIPFSKGKTLIDCLLNMKKEFDKII